VSVVASRTLVGAVLAALGAGGCAATVLLVYFTDEHHVQKFTLGMPGDLLFALASLVMLLGGLGLLFGRRSEAKS
jgi:hypothetical protein